MHNASAGTFYISFDCRIGLKVGVVGAVLKLTYDYDIWSLDSKEGAKKLAALKETVVPGTIVFPKEVCTFP